MRVNFPLMYRRRRPQASRSAPRAEAGIRVRRSARYVVDHGQVPLCLPPILVNATPATANPVPAGRSPDAGSVYISSLSELKTNDRASINLPCPCPR